MTKLMAKHATYAISRTVYTKSLYKHQPGQLKLNTYIKYEQLFSNKCVSVLGIKTWSNVLKIVVQKELGKTFI